MLLCMLFSPVTKNSLLERAWHWVIICLNIPSLLGYGAFIKDKKINSGINLLDIAKFIIYCPLMSEIKKTANIG